MRDLENEHDLGALIKEAYSPPLPEKPFVESLRASLCRELQSLPEVSQRVTRRPRHRPAAAMQQVIGSAMRHRRLAVATAATVVVTLLVLPFVIPGTTDRDSGGANLPSRQDNMVTAAPKASKEPVRPPSATPAGEWPLEEDVAEAPVIVRARATARNQATVEYRVTKVLKGKLTEDLITVQIPEALAGDPSDAKKRYAIEQAKKRYAIGQEVILFLSSFRETEKAVIWNASSWWYDVSPSHRLDDREKVILAALAKAPPAAADGLAAEPDRIVKGRTRSDGRRARGKSLAPADADRAVTPDKAKIEAEAKQIAAMAAAGDIDGLIKMLSVAEFVNKVAADDEALGAKTGAADSRGPGVAQRLVLEEALVEFGRPSRPRVTDHDALAGLTRDERDRELGMAAPRGPKSCRRRQFGQPCPIRHQALASSGGIEYPPRFPRISDC